MCAAEPLPPPVHIEIAANRPVKIVPISNPPTARMPAPGPMAMPIVQASTTVSSIGNSDGARRYGRTTAVFFTYLTFSFGKPNPAV
jgi:hypothetical protein